MLTAANHLGDVITGEFDVQAARDSSRGLVGLEKATDLIHDRLKATRLVAGRRRDRIAVHRIRHPRDRTAVLTRDLQERRKRLTDALRPHARDERQASLLTIRVDAINEAEHLIRRGRRAELDPNRVANTRQQLDVSALLVACPLPRPQEVSGGVVGLARPRIDTRHGRLVLEQQRLVGRIQVNVSKSLEVDARCTHELDRTVNILGQRLVARVGRVRHETLIPAVHLTQVRVAALREGADQVQRRGRVVIQRQEALRVRLTRLGGELEGVYGVATVAGQSDAVARFHIRRTRLGVLAGDTADLDDRQRGTVRQDDRHLQQRLNLQAHVVSRRLGEGLGAVSAHQDEGLAAGSRTHPRAQIVYLPGEHERRLAAQLRRHITEVLRVRVGRLLGSVQATPRVPGSALPGLGRPQTLGDAAGARLTHRLAAASGSDRRNHAERLTRRQARRSGRSRPSSRGTRGRRCRRACRPRCAGTGWPSGGRRPPRRGR